MPVGHPDLPEQLALMAAGLSGIHVIGTACLGDRSEREVSEALVARLQETTEDTLELALSSSSRADFKAGRVNEVEGWLLSETECLLAALGVAAGGGAHLEDAGVVQRSFLTVTAWGPDRTYQGQVFNPLSDGRGAIWVTIEGDVSDSVRVVLDGVPLVTQAGVGLLTAAVPEADAQRLVELPGRYAVELLDFAQNWIQPLGELVVEPVPDKSGLSGESVANAFCQPSAWGPKNANFGEPFNEQPGGHSALWVQISCVPADTIVVLDNQVLPTTLSEGLVTAVVARHLELGPGSYPVELRSEQAGESLRLGYLEIRP